MKKKWQSEISEPQRNSIRLGILAGLIYALFAWGWDAFSMLKAHASLPLVKLAIGLLPTIAVFALVSWVSTRNNHMVARMLLWMAAASILSYLVSLLTFQAYGAVLCAAHPQFGAAINYITPAGIRGRLFVIMVLTNVLFLVGGLLLDNAGEALYSSLGTVGWLIPVLLCLAFFAGAGYTADANFNAELRGQITAVDAQLEEVAQLDLQSLSERDQRMLQRFTRLQVDLQGTRRLLIASFDDAFSQVQMLIDFNGQWAQCLTLNGRVSTCELME